MANDSALVVRALWDRIAARDWERAGDTLAENVVISWPHTGELIRGRDRYMEINRRYPEGWSVEIRRVFGDAGQAVLEARVPHRSLGVSFVAGFYRVQAGRISEGTEYWVDEAAQPPPVWRSRLTDRS